MKVMAEGAEERGKRGQEGWHQNALFYVDYGMFVLLDPQWLQGKFSNLAVMLDRMILRTNYGNTVGMFCRPCQVAETQLEAAYEQRMAGEVPSYREQHKGRVKCREYRYDMAERS